MGKYYLDCSTDCSTCAFSVQPTNCLSCSDSTKKLCTPNPTGECVTECSSCQITKNYEDNTGKCIGS